MTFLVKEKLSLDNGKFTKVVETKIDAPNEATARLQSEAESRIARRLCSSITGYDVSRMSSEILSIEPIERDDESNDDDVLEC